MKISKSRLTCDLVNMLPDIIAKLREISPDTSKRHLSNPVFSSELL